MKNFAKKVFIVFIVLIVMNAVFDFITGDNYMNITTNVKNVLKDNDYYKLQNHELYLNEYNVEHQDYVKFDSICFDFESYSFMMQSVGEIKNDWHEYIIISRSFDGDFYSLTYGKRKDEMILERIYSFSKSQHTSIELIKSEFDEDYFAYTEDEKKELFDLCDETFYNVINDLGISDEDFQD